MEENLDNLDYSILRLVSNNARISFLEVARLCNVSGAAVHQRVQKMINNGVIISSEFRLEMSKIGYHTTAFVQLYVGQGVDKREVIEGIKKIDEVVECHLISSDYDILLKLYTRNNSHLRKIIEESIMPLGVERTKTVISFEELYSRQMKFE